MLGCLLALCEHKGFFAVGLKNMFFIAITIPLFTILIFTIAKSLHQLSILHEQAESRIRQIASIVESSDDAILGKGLDGIITSWNKAAENIYGYAAQEIIGRNVSILLPPETGDEMLNIIKKIKNGEKVDHYETIRIRKDSRCIYVSITASPIKDAGGNIIGASTIARDITEQKRVNEEIKALNENLRKRTAELETANKELEAFSYSVSHDLRAPLRAISGFTQILTEDYSHKLDDEAKRIFGVVTQNVRRMGQLIDDLLNFSRIGKKPIRIAPIDIEQITRDASEELKPIMAGRKIEIIRKELPTTYGDRLLIRQVVQNLLANAIKFTSTREKAVIEICGQEGEKENTYSIKDNGVGFDMQYAHKLFGVFQRLHKADEFEGTGVGLAIIQRIIHRHGGRVWAEGRVGQGATFYFTLPQIKEFIIE